MELDSSVEMVKGVGGAMSKNLAIAGIRSIDDLIRYYPRAYNDYSKISPISKTKPGQITLRGKFSEIKGRYVRRGMHITEAVLSDTTGSVRIVWFNQPYRAKNTDNEKEYFVSGLFELRRQKMVITNPSTELVSNFPVNTARIVPVYSSVKSLKSGQIRKIINNALNELASIEEILPAEILNKFDLVSELEAIKMLHFPKNADDVVRAKERLGFQEVFELILAHMALRNDILKERSIPVPFDQKLAKKFVKHLSFNLTDDQRLCVWQVYKDIEKMSPMNRLVEGDVGSGKTVVAAMAGAMVVAEGMQTVLLAPTEILARQHAETLEAMLKPLGLEKSLVLLTGSMNKKQKDSAAKSIKNGQAKFIVGTHALIQESIDMQKLGLVIVDEQHRFGVDQRRILLKKAGHTPHMLSMTATPIPRSLALTVYGDLDISLLKQKPPGKLPIKTEIIELNTRTQTYKKILKEVENKRQAFVVCPLIEESTAIISRSVSKVYKELSEGVFANKNVGMLHGKMRAEEKQSTMQDFVDGKTDVLVSTTVIEVGVDVPNATVMCVENPERFGLAQIHQLRGRVGRGKHPGLCYLMLNDNKPPTRRISALKQSSDGFKLAQLDMEIRGPGAIYGRSQHGLLDLQIANLSDVDLIKKARSAAKNIISSDPDLLQYKGLKKRINKLQKIVHLN